MAASSASVFDDKIGERYCYLARLGRDNAHIITTQKRGQQIQRTIRVWFVVQLYCGRLAFKYKSIAANIEGASGEGALMSNRSLWSIIDWQVAGPKAQSSVLPC